MEHSHETIQDLFDEHYFRQRSPQTEPVILESASGPDIAALAYNYDQYFPKPQTGPHQPPALARTIREFTGRNIGSCRYGISAMPVEPNFRINPGHPMDLRTETAAYINRLSEYDPRRLDFAIKAAEAFGEPTLASNDLDAVVAIPMALHNEKGRLRKTVELANTFSTRALSQRVAKTMRACANELHATRATYPHVPIRFMIGAYIGMEPTIGMVRSELWDAILIDQLMRGRKDPLPVIGNDIDGKYINKAYLPGFVEDFGRQLGPLAVPDVVTAPVYMELPDGVDENSALARLLALSTYLVGERAPLQGFGHVWDGNSGWSLATVAAIGNFDRSCKLAEGEMMFQDIRHTRGDIACSRITEEPTLVSDSRRYIETAARNYPIHMAWDDRVITFGANNSVRSREPRIKEALKNAQEHGDSWAQKMLDKFYLCHPPAQTKHIYQIARELFGFDVHQPRFED